MQWDNCISHELSLMCVRLQKGGLMVYSGPLGPNCATMVDYFTAHGSPSLGLSENPAEYMLRELSVSKNRSDVQDWAATWNGTAFILASHHICQHSSTQHRHMRLLVSWRFRPKTTLQAANPQLSQLCPL